MTVSNRIFSLLLLVAVVLTVSCAEASTTSSAFFARTRVGQLSTEQSLCLKVRGGAVADSDDEEDSDDYLESEAEESLLRSTVAATKKSRRKKTKAVKKTVNVSLSKTKSSVSSKKSNGPLLRIPYVVRMFMNPLTIFAMTKAYFGSLFNVDYLDEDTSQTLRSALEQKAKNAVHTGKKKAAKKMRPGQAKTLSDLPELNS